MHFTIEQVLWAVLLAAHLLLLIVLIGRERTLRFRWFTAYIGLSAISLIANHLLHGKLTMVAFYWQNYTLLALLAIVALFMLGELAKQTFSNGKGPLIAKPNLYIGWATILITLSAVAVWLWGRPWPSLQALTANPTQLRLYIVILIGMKGQLGVMILTVLAAIVMWICGPRFGSGWRSHSLQIALALSTSAVAFLAVQAINDVLSHTLHPKSQAEYAHAVQLVTRLENGRIVVWIISLLWILFWVWRDEPGTPKQTAAVPVSAGPVLIEGSATQIQAEDSTDNPA